MSRYRLRASLVDSDPEIWRTFEIRGRARLRTLHLALQTMFGWREMHLHAFTDADPWSPATGRRWESPDFPDADADALSEDDFTVDDALKAAGPLWYEYDFGDGWIHRIDVVERMPDEPHLAPVVLLDGANRGPFEDAGGVHGYYDKLMAAADPQHPEHASIVDWIRTTVGPWAPPAEPTFFDPIGAQTELNLQFAPEESGVSPYDMSGLVKAEQFRRPGDIGEASPLATLAGQLPPPIRSELRQHLDRTEVLEPLGYDDETAARIIRPFSWLMDAIGRDGLALTAAGWMPPDTVLAGMTELGWIDDWIGKGNREDLTPPIAELRETAQRIGLVRVQKGRLLLSAAAKKALGNPKLQLRLVAGGLYRKLSDAETDAAVLLLLSIADGTPPEERWRTVAFGLEVCGWRSASGRRFTRADIEHATFHAVRVLDRIGETSLRRRRMACDGPLVKVFAAEALR